MTSRFMGRSISTRRLSGLANGTGSPGSGRGSTPERRGSTAPLATNAARPSRSSAANGPGAPRRQVSALAPPANAPAERQYFTAVWTGSQMVVDDRGRFAGSVSGGCVESAVIEAALDAWLELRALLDLRCPEAVLARLGDDATGAFGRGHAT